MKRTFTLALAAAATFAAASPAQAALVNVTPATACSTSGVGPAADACTGWWRGNLNGQSAGVYADTLAALKLLDPTIASFTSLAYIPSLNGSSTINFGITLSGKTIIGIHRGGAGDFRPDGTAFYLWNNLPQTGSLTNTIPGISNATLYMTSAVPEPGTWMLMIAGIGLMGWQLRRRRQSVKVSYA
ncbi:MAG: hypothetical protein RL339_2886 [Pseudomonadota bacterium]